MHPLGAGFFPRILSECFGAVSAMRNTLYDRVPQLSQSAARPVISVGALHAGGTGKTPLALLIGRFYHEKGRHVAFLSRGYGRQSKGLVISNPHTLDSWENVGDEPALLHSGLPESWLGISKNRIDAAKALNAITPTNIIFILDDGFQHRQIKRNIDIVCLPVDPFVSRLIPMGTLREPLERCKRANILCVIGSRSQAHELELTRERLSGLTDGKDIICLYQTPVYWKNLMTGESVARLPCNAPTLICGIARPERFFNLVSDLGIQPAHKVVYNDHHPFTAEEIQELCRANCDGIVTTEKDSFRLNTLKLVNCPDIWYLKMDLSFSDAGSKELLYSHLNGLLLP
jgi:tetraacyldisaccharide 4'-kinase